MPLWLEVDFLVCPAKGVHSRGSPIKGVHEEEERIFIWPPVAL